MKPEAGLNRLKDCYMFAHLTYCLLTATCLVGWIRATQMKITDGYHLVWIICMVAILALLPAQHRIITQTFLQDYRNLHLYKILYASVICVIYIPIITGVIAKADLSILTIVPVILTSIICGTLYGMATALVMSLTTFYVSFIDQGYNSTLFTEQILLLALLGTTAWFIGQSFEYMKNLYQQLLTSEKYLKKTLDNLGIATLHVNRSGDIIHGNERFEELIGAEITEGTNFYDIAGKHFPFLHVMLNDISNLVDSHGEANPVFGQALDGLGRRIPVQCILYPTGSGLDDDRGVLICMHDISLSQKLEEEKILTNHFIDFINAGVVLADAPGNIIEMNRQAEELLNISKGAAINNNLGDLLGRLAGDKPGPDTRSGFELELGSRSLLVNCADLCTKGGRLIGSVCIINDISDKKELERKMHRSATLSAIGELAAGTAHEIRNPLTSIKGFLQLIKEKKENRIKDIDNYFKLILDEVDRINNIVVEFLRLARPSKIKMEELQLDNVIDSIWDLLYNEALLKDVKLSRLQDPGLPPVLGNADMIKQVLINLVNNAIQAAGSGGAVWLITVRHKDGARLSVEDNGLGIEKDALPRIFDPYFTTRDEGTGLGLAITSKIIDDHNASIYVNSKLGKGACFNVTFPPVEAVEQALNQD